MRKDCSKVCFSDFYCSFQPFDTSTMLQAIEAWCVDNAMLDFGRSGYVLFLSPLFAQSKPLRPSKGFGLTICQQHVNTFVLENPSKVSLICPLFGIAGGNWGIVEDTKLHNLRTSDFWMICKLAVLRPSKVELARCSSASFGSEFNLDFGRFKCSFKLDVAGVTDTILKCSETKNQFST